MFNWDGKAQPNDGYFDHIGVVETVAGTMIHTIEGNSGEVVTRRTYRVGEGCISGMPVAFRTYWNQVHGFAAEDVIKDMEGLQTMRNLARNMALMVKAFERAKEELACLMMETGFFTGFPDGK